MRGRRLFPTTLLFSLVSLLAVPPLNAAGTTVAVSTPSPALKEVFESLGRSALAGAIAPALRQSGATNPGSPGTPGTQATETKPAWQSVTDADVEGITYDDVQVDITSTCPWMNDYPEALDDERKKYFDEWDVKLRGWEHGKPADLAQRLMNYCSLLAVIDIAMRADIEFETPPIVFGYLRDDIPEADFKKAAAYLILHADKLTPRTTAVELEIEADIDPEYTRARAADYAKKMLGRLMGKLPKEE